MKQTNPTGSELALLFKLLPAMQELENVDSVYRLLVSIATSGRVIGYNRAMLFTVVEKDGVMRGLYGVSRHERTVARSRKAATFEDMARDVFTVYDGVESTDTSLKARSFSVPLGWHRSALVKALKTGYPVLAERRLSEFATDPFFDFFDSDGYVAVPIKLTDRVSAVLAADNKSEQRSAFDDVSLLYSLCQQAATAAQHLLEASDHRRKSRILWKLHQSLSEADSRETLDQALKLALVMLTRALGASGCFLKDLTRQKTIHIRSVQDYGPEEDRDDIRIAEDFDTILDQAAGTMESMSGNSDDPLLCAATANVVQFFFACPLMAGGDVAGSVAIYTESADNTKRAKDYTTEEKGFVQLCAAIIASQIENNQKQDRIDRIEDLVTEISSNLAKERHWSRLGESSLDYHQKITADLKLLREQLSSRSPFAKRFPRMSEIVKSMQDYTNAYRKNFEKENAHYALTRLFDLTRDAIARWQPAVVERGIEVTVRIPAASPTLLLDEQKIRLAIANILDTTASCLQKGDRMLIECSTDDERALICIADNGRGLPGDAVSRLFMPFERMDPANDKKRALSLAGEIIQKHAGDIRIKSSRSWKTILVLGLPLAANRDRRKRRDRRGRGDRRVPVERP